VDTGEIPHTSYLASGIPANQVVYARIWTETGGVWRSADSTFSGFTKASFVYPPAGAANVDVNIPIQWTSAPGVQAYVLYVGTTPGAKNLVETNEFLQTSYTASNLPPNQTVYARIWTKIAGGW